MPAFPKGKCRLVAAAQVPPHPGMGPSGFSCMCPMLTRDGANLRCQWTLIRPCTHPALPALPDSQAPSASPSPRPVPSFSLCLPWHWLAGPGRSVPEPKVWSLWPLPEQQMSRRSGWFCTESPGLRIEQPGNGQGPCPAPSAAPSAACSPTLSSASPCPLHTQAPHPQGRPISTDLVSLGATKGSLGPSQVSLWLSGQTQSSGSFRGFLGPCSSLQALERV